VVLDGGAQHPGRRDLAPRRRVRDHPHGNRLAVIDEFAARFVYF
jgi:hypothetical protein